MHDMNNLIGVIFTESNKSAFCVTPFIHRKQAYGLKSHKGIYFLQRFW